MFSIWCCMHNHTLLLNEVNVCMLLQFSLGLVFRFKEDRNLMDLAGKGTSHSAGYREAPPEED